MIKYLHVIIVLTIAFIFIFIVTSDSHSPNLKLLEQPSLDARLLARVEQPVDRVHPHGHSRHPGRQLTQKRCLWRMGVNDRRAKLPKQPDQANQSH